MLVEGVIHTDGETIADPIVEAPVIKDFVTYHPDEFCLANLEWMFEL